MKRGTIIQVDAAVGFLLDRSQTIDLIALPETSRGGYIWKRVFLKGRRNRP